MPNKDCDPNAVLILGESHERKSIFGDTRAAPSLAAPIEPGGRFDILPASGMARKAEEKEQKKNESSIAGLEKPALTSENYQEVYLKNQRENAAKEDEGKKDAQADRAAAQKDEEKKRNEQRFRARELQNQIAFWEQQRGQGLYDDGTIDAMLEQIRRELGTIPSGLW